MYGEGAWGVWRGRECGCTERGARGCMESGRKCVWRVGEGVYGEGEGVYGEWVRGCMEMDEGV